MSITVSCDYCGKPIETYDAQQVTLWAKGDEGGSRRGRWKDGYVAHYHGEPCFEDVIEAIRLIHEDGDNLEAIPTATPAQLAEWQPGDHEGETRWITSLSTRITATVMCSASQEALLGDVFPHRFRDCGIATIGDLRRAIADGGIRRVEGIGPRKAASIEAALKAYVSQVVS